MKRLIIVGIVLVTAGLSGCGKFLEIPLPTTAIAGSGAYTTDKSSAAVLNDQFATLANGSVFDGRGISFQTALYTDELKCIEPTALTENIFYSNNVQASNTGAMWTTLYKQIYAANLALEGISGSQTLNYKDQWLGEAYFLRGLLYFYVASLYGDAPISTTSFYKTNNALSRSPQNDVYKQVVKDLLEAQKLLSVEYKGANGLVATNRGRPNKAAATALLARVYLYLGEWENAELQSTTIIADPAYMLPQPDLAFLAASKETIWGLIPSVIGFQFVRDYAAYNNGTPATVALFPFNGVNTVLTTDLLNAFEAGDARFTSWTREVSSTSGTPITYRFPNKYKVNTTGAEYLTVFRLAEQLLIRAEARAQLNKITGTNSAKADLDAVRTRAALTGTTATTKDDMLAAIAKERRIEFFTEGGHRMLDLRRTNKLEALMLTVAPQKGGVWQTFKQWWPIPTADVFANPNLIQTPGYQ
ncbi:RagB/SusD family nutrient uptake outer membrane protein [Chitinophaga sp. SYP-B3965]|uniref:RagB/SusD family nutrient uptake outer membrane protein n=1 Tax=Chitinophaga sp. SYP-B3965 TaxID=2663120 RepID=UPI001299886E|nr:RagB/SusD family nutrient uptake outer membrane protein [Chitinophaga sp. SYP-B3965]MRG44845.1 RagB/SusD family nutrient uptake outer membrane protein [Chitinophaga sp. SYP-B3965]